MEVKVRVEVRFVFSNRQRPRTRIRRIKPGEFWQVKDATRWSIPTGEELRRLQLKIGTRAAAAGLTEEDVEREVEAYRAGL